MTANATTRTPLAGITVLDLSRVLAGPWCTMTLGDLGADVIKVEQPKGGDDTRSWAPFVDGESTYYQCTNRNKRSVAIDISRPDGQALVRDLARQADVVVENFRLGALERYGLDYISLSTINPRLVYCSISGYGRQSPLADRPGYDYVIQAEAGLMSVTGEKDGEPMKVGVAVADLFAGMNATQAVLAALLARSHTGRGQHIDIALFDSQVAALANVASAYLMTGQETQRYGNAHASVVPYQLFPTRDGSIVVAVGNDSQFRTLCETVIECPELATDPRFVRNADRVTHRDALIPFLSDALAQRDSAEWLRRLEEASIPHGSVRSVGEALRAPEVTARNMVRSVLHPVLGAIELVASPLKLSDTPVVEPRTPPLLGEHTDEVLRERLGLSDRRIDELRAQGIVGVKS